MRQIIPLDFPEVCPYSPEYRGPHGVSGGLRPSFSLDNGRSAGVDKPPRFCYADIAEVAELVDALGSGSSGCTPVRVQVPASAP